jgi:hypothetical protein
VITSLEWVQLSQNVGHIHTHMHTYSAYPIRSFHTIQHAIMQLNSIIGLLLCPLFIPPFFLYSARPLYIAVVSQELPQSQSCTCPRILTEPHSLMSLMVIALVSVLPDSLPSHFISINFRFASSISLLSSGCWHILVLSLCSVLFKFAIINKTMSLHFFFGFHVCVPQVQNPI